MTQTRSSSHEHREGAAARGNRPSPSLLRRVISAQEFGLVAVIVLMVIGLTFFSESITRRDRTRLVEGATLEETPAAFVVRTPDGGTSTYTKADGWEVYAIGSGLMAERAYSVDKFLNKENLIGVATSASFIAIMAVGMAGIIIMGGIDLSVGSIYALAAVVGAMALRWLGSMGDPSDPMPSILSIPVGVAICCAIGGACGLVNGVATVGLRVHPFIITLGGMAVYRGIAFVATKGQSIGGFPESYTGGGFRVQAARGIMPVPMLLMVAVAIAGAFILHRTVFGRWTFAIGGNETAARYAGISVGRTKVLLFTIGGALAGLSAAMLLGYYGAASSDAGPGYELKVIAAAVVGGASLTGGRGSAIGAMLGAVVIQLIDNGIVVLGIDSNYTNIVIGLAIVLAVVVDQAKHRFLGGRG